MKRLFLIAALFLLIFLNSCATIPNKDIELRIRSAVVDIDYYSKEQIDGGSDIKTLPDLRGDK